VKTVNSALGLLVALAVCVTPVASAFDQPGDYQAETQKTRESTQDTTDEKPVIDDPEPRYVPVQLC